MAYADSNTYNKYQDCGCDDSASCDCNSGDCGCCPIGTIEVKDSCGKFVGCMIPSDAAQYYVDTISTSEGYVKAFDPNTGVYVGLLTPTELCAYLECVGTTGVAGFNILGGLSNQVTDTFTSGVPGATSAQQTIVDRFGVNADITVQLILPSVLGVSLNGTSVKVDSAGTVITSANNVIMEETSLYQFTVDYDGTANTLGTYYGVIKYSGAGVDRYMKLTLTFN